MEDWKEKFHRRRLDIERADSLECNRGMDDWGDFFDKQGNIRRNVAKCGAKVGAPPDVVQDVSDGITAAEQANKKKEALDEVPKGKAAVTDEEAKAEAKRMSNDGFTPKEKAIFFIVITVVVGAISMVCLIVDLATTDWFCWGARRCDILTKQDHPFAVAAFITLIIAVVNAFIAGVIMESAWAVRIIEILKRSSGDDSK